MPKVQIDGIVLNVPDSWEDRTVFSFVGPEDKSSDHRLGQVNAVQGVRPNLVVIREPSAGLELEAYALVQLEASKKELRGFEVVSERKRVVGNAEAIERIYTFVPPDSARVQGMQVFVMSGAFVHTLTFSSVPFLFAAHRPSFESILALTPPS